MRHRKATRCASRHGDAAQHTAPRPAHQRPLCCPPRLNRHRRAGFATIAAILMITVVAAAILAMTHQFRIDNHRTRTARDDAQLRQLLHAGVTRALADLRARAAADQPAPQNAINLETPTPLTRRDAALSVTIQPGDNAFTLHVTATLDGQSLKQVVHLESQNDALTLTCLETPAAPTGEEN